MKVRLSQQAIICETGAEVTTSTVFRHPLAIVLCNMGKCRLEGEVEIQVIDTQELQFFRELLIRRTARIELGYKIRYNS